MAGLYASAAILLYLTAAALQCREVLQQRDKLLPAAAWTALLAMLCHGMSLTQTAMLGEGYSLGFFQASSLIFLLVGIATLLSLKRRPLQNLLVILLPLAALTVALAAITPTTRTKATDFDIGLLMHIVISALAYAVLTIAALQALALALLDSRLKHHRTTGLVRMLPPLQLMETMLFELIWLGVILLTFSIGSGFLFLEDMFEQRLAHKTILTVAAWVTFSTLLWGRHIRGWRSKTAVRWTLGGFIVLMLGFFGSKFVLELVLGQV